MIEESSKCNKDNCNENIRLQEYASLKNNMTGSGFSFCQGDLLLGDCPIVSHLFSRKLRASFVVLKRTALSNLV